MEVEDESAWRRLLLDLGGDLLGALLGRGRTRLEVGDLGVVQRLLLAQLRKVGGALGARALELRRSRGDAVVGGLRARDLGRELRFLPGNTLFCALGLVEHRLGRARDALDVVEVLDRLR